MTISATPTVLDGRLIVRGKVVLTKVPENVVAHPASNGSAFLGASSTSMSSRHIFTLGVLEGFRLMSIFRFKIWWTIPSFGNSGRDVPLETQVLLLEVVEKTALHDVDTETPSSEGTLYVLFLPALEGQFRTSLQGTSENELQLCVESG